MLSQLSDHEAFAEGSWLFMHVLFASLIIFYVCFWRQNTGLDGPLMCCIMAITLSIFLPTYCFLVTVSIYSKNTYHFDTSY